MNRLKNVSLSTFLHDIFYITLTLSYISLLRLLHRKNGKLPKNTSKWLIYQHYNYYIYPTLTYFSHIGYHYILKFLTVIRDSSANNSLFAYPVDVLREYFRNDLRELLVCQNLLLFYGSTLVETAMTHIKQKWPRARRESLELWTLGLRLTDGYCEQCHFIAEQSERTGEIVSLAHW